MPGVVLYAGEPIISPSQPPSSGSSRRRPHTASSSAASSASSSRSKRRLPPPPETTDVRTNFTTIKAHTGQTQQNDPILGEQNGDDYPLLEEIPEKEPVGIQALNATANRTFVGSISVIIGAILGVGIGLGLSQLHMTKDSLQWLALPGELFVRALRCLIVPMVFCTMSVAIAEVIVLNKTSILTWRTGAIFFLSSFLATSQGVTVAMIYRGIFQSNSITNTTSSTQLVFGLKCHNGYFLQANGSYLSCSSKYSNVSTSQFQVDDINEILQRNSTGVKNLSLTEQVISIINTSVPDNIFASLSQGALLSIIMFALPLGYAVAKSHSGPDHSNVLLSILRQTRNALLILVNAVLYLTPVAVVFLISDAIISYGNATTIMYQGGYLMLAFTTGILFHVLVMLPLVVCLFTRTNPYNYMRQLFPAYVFAFGCSSSMASLPVAVTVIHQTRFVSRSMAQLVMCLGTPVNLNASGIYYPVLIIFMANVAGLNSAFGPPQWAVLYFVTLLGCMGTAPVPNAGLAMLMTIWKTVLPNQPLPTAFVYVVAIDVLLDRICTMTNIHGNMMVTRILAAKFDDGFESWSNEPPVNQLES
ncbi:dicarboxylate/amino acid:cation (Na or H) symporter (DAACS) family protein [Thraustotheca clavata]|uniref:Amino acid transporter n=1 Tax=Thraustotheca clavata TaxID=74557 RepID=A0A1V9ZZL3_9STRA|nr:dicarboxylate/amino acid:cation (Na or H) symporter (DAACS) family protein [Thraustotheca clavata]